MKNRTKRAFLSPHIPCALLTLMTGCAALTIDVDVYKGPLVEDIQVQTKSTTAMAKGALPLLIQLRNTLEEEAIVQSSIRSATHWDYPEGAHDHPYPYVKKSTCLGKHKLQEFQNRQNYGDGFIPQDYEFCHEQAFRVNAILSLYEDQEYTPITEPVQTIKQALKDYKNFELILFPPSTTRDVQSREWDRLKMAFKQELQEPAEWTQLQPFLLIEKFITLAQRQHANCTGYSCSIKSDSSFKKVLSKIPERNSTHAFFKILQKLKNPGNADYPKQYLRELIDAGNPHYDNLPLRQAFASAYHGFLAPDEGRREIKKIFELHQSLNTRLQTWPSIAKLLDSSELYEEACSDQEASDCEASVTAMYLALAENTKNIVNLHANLLFAAEGAEKRAFISNTIQAAQSFVKVREATQKIYRALLTMNHFLDLPQERTKQIKEQHGSKIPEMIIGISRGKYLLAALEKLERLEDSAKLKHEVSDQIAQRLNLFKTIRQEDLRYVPSALPKPIDWLGLGAGKLPQQRQNRQTSRDIRTRLKERLTTDRERTSDLFLYLDALHSKQKKNRLYFGVSGGPDQRLDDDWIDIIQQIANIVSDVPIAAGLGQGRLDEGLHTLMKRYSDAVNTRPVDKDLIKDERDRLYESLIQFSKTVLFFANNQILLGDGIDDTFQDLQAFKKKEIKKDTQILQAVGNSILNQIDEIYHRERYEVALDKKGPRENLAMRVAFPKYATEAVDQLIANFEAEAKTTHEQFLERSDEYKEKHNALESMNKAKEAAIKARDDAKMKIKQKEETRNLYSKNSGLLFETSKGTTVGGEIVHVPSSSSIGATGTFSDSSLLTGILRPDDQILRATYKGGEYTSTNGGSAIGYGGMLDDLMIIGNGTTTDGRIIHGTLEDASFESNNLNNITITVDQITINTLENFTGRLSVPNAKQKSLSLEGAQTTELSLTKLKNEKGEEFEVGMEIPKGSKIRGNVKELNLNILTTVEGCNQSNNYNDDCKVSNGTLSDVKLTNVSADNVKTLYVHDKIRIQSIADVSLKDMTLRDVTMTVNKNSTLKGTIQSTTQWTLGGTIDWNNKSLSLKDKAYCFKEDQKQCLKGGKLKTAQKVPISFSSEAKDSAITVSLSGKGLTVHWKDPEKLTLQDGRITNVWILDGTTTSGNKKVSGEGSIVSGATLKNDEEKKIILQNPTIHNLHVKSNKLFGLIVKADLVPDSTPATKGTASGGTLNTNGTENSIQASSRIDATAITQATAEQSTVHLRTSGNSKDIFFAIEASLLSGTVSGTLESGEIVPNQTGASAKNVTIKNATVKSATVEDAVIQGADGEKFEGTVLGNLSHLLLTGATVSTLQSGQIDQGKTTLSKAEIGATHAIEKNSLTVKNGKATGVTITNVTLQKGSFTNATTRNGKTQYSAFVVLQPSTNKVSRATFLNNLSNRIAKGTTASSTHPLRKEQLANLQKLIEKQSQRKLSTELTKLLPLDNADYCSRTTNKCTPGILSHILLQELREETVKAKKAADTASQELKNKEMALKTTQTKVDIAKVAQQEFLNKHLEKFKAARDTFTILQPSILQHLAGKDRLTSTDMIYAEIVEFLESEENASKSNSKDGATKRTQNEIGKKIPENDKQKALAITIDIVKSKPEPLQVLYPAAMKNLDAKEVMDQLITTLKYKHIAAVHDGGKNSAMAQQIKESWEVAKKHRANLIHIRPALAYLRSSYPSTALQGEAPLEWQNMLTANAYRSIPFFSNPKNGKSWSWDRDPRLEIQSQIDKQFWHSVNRIRLNGAGLTNYVLMKDDIGNWTVKNYSSDSRDIIRSARNLALFGYGAGVGTNLLTPSRLRALDSEQPLADQLNDVAGDDADNEDTSLLSWQFEKFEKLYAEQTDTDLTASESLNKELSGNIKGVWSKESALNDVVIELSTILGLAEETHLASVKPSRSSIEEKEKEIINRVAAVKKFHREAELKILEKRQELMNNDENKKTREAYEQAITLMTGHVQQALLDYIEKRQKAIDTFRTQATVLHDSVMQ